MNNDPWLERWLPLIRERTEETEILEIGCGWGWDTAVLTGAGLQVFAIDLVDVTQAQKAAPKARFQKIDVREFLSTQSDKYHVIVASLSLHYLPWTETVTLVDGIFSALEPNGLFLMRVNSTEDVNYGAVGNPEIERHFYQVGERTKRFFDGSDLANLFDDRWQILSQEKMTIDRFDRLKTVWEVMLEKADLGL